MCHCMKIQLYRLQKKQFFCFADYTAWILSCQIFDVLSEFGQWEVKWSPDLCSDLEGPTFALLCPMPTTRAFCNAYNPKQSFKASCLVSLVVCICACLCVMCTCVCACVGVHVPIEATSSHLVSSFSALYIDSESVFESKACPFGGWGGQCLAVLPRPASCFSVLSAGTVPYMSPCPA